MVARAVVALWEERKVVEEELSQLPRLRRRRRAALHDELDRLQEREHALLSDLGGQPGHDGNSQAA